MFVAGKDNGPNSVSLETASRAMNELEMTLNVLKASHQPQNPGWHFSSITVPYQFVNVYYLTFWSDYGVYFEYGIKLDDCKYGRRGIYPETGDVTIASIPGDISCVIRDLTSAKVEDDGLLELRREIENRELFGHELIPQLKTLLKMYGHAWHNGSAQLQGLLEIQRLLNKTR